MRKAQRKSALATAVLLGIGGVLLMRSPPEMAIPLRRVVADAAHPGQSTLARAADACKTWRLRLQDSAWQAERLKALSAELAATRLELRRSRLEASLLREDLQAGPTAKIPDSEIATGAPLLQAALLQARVIGGQSADWWRAGKWIDQGAPQGVEETALVLEGTQTLIDQGLDAEVRDGQPVYAGRAVVGRILLAGRWSSLVQPICDPKFSAAARIMHESSQGFLEGPEGILEGHRDGLCRLKFIQATVPVQVGDQVTTGGRDGAFPLPMVYGTIVTATLHEGAPHWEIVVQPQCDVRELEEVHVFRRTVNRDRLLAN